MDKDEFVRQQLTIAQAAIKAVFLLLETEEPADACRHTNKIDLSTMGEECWICRDCGYKYTEGGGESFE
jgi:transposase-like protein